MTGIFKIAALLIAVFTCTLCSAANEPSFSVGGPFGNVFSKDEKPSFKITTTAEEIQYSIIDYFGKTVLEGSLKPEGGSVVFAPEISEVGHFNAKFKLRMQDGSTADKELDFARLPSFKGIDLSKSPFGVMTHFAQNWNVELIPLLPKYGVASVRDEVYWNQAEKQKGVFDFSKSDLYMSKFKEAGIQPLIVLSFSNKNYDNDNTPFTDEGRAGYANYAKEIIQHYGDQIKFLEVWNEYNGSFCKGPAKNDRPKFYTEMVKATYAKIKETKPDVTVIGCAPVLIPLPYFEGIFKQGGLAFMDGVVIHPYRGRPEGVDRELGELNALMAKYNNGAAKPVWCTEYGYYVGPNEPRHSIARNLVRTSVLMLSQGVERMYWYLFSDYAEFKTMGLVQLPNSPKGAHAPNLPGAAFANMVSLLHDAKYTEREARKSFSKVQVHKFTKPSGENIRVCWTTYPSTIILEGTGKLTKVDIMGNESPVDLTSGKAELPLDETPFYLIGPLTSVAEKPSDESIIADSVEEYSNKQGDNHWSYGYFDNSGTYTDKDFKEMRQVETVWGVNWAGDPQYLALSREGGHPSLQGGKPVWSVRRWESPVDGKVRLDGEISVGDQKKDGDELVILVDDKEVTRELVTPKNKTLIQLEIEVKKGSHVDFCVNPGPKNNLNFAAFGFDVRMFVKNSH